MAYLTPLAMGSPRTSSRKQQHVEIVLSKNVAFRGKTSGFERWDLVHNALPELDLEEVDASTTFLGKRLRIPLLVTGMTGGYGGAEKINRLLAEVCAERGLALGVGSQRQALENARFRRSYSVVREAAPDIPVVGNIGAAEVAHLADAGPLRRMVELIRADALAVHLNPVQEFLQPEGTPRFAGVLVGIERLVHDLGVPVIVKEIGSGISAAVLRRLLDVGVRIVDVAGAGGTSWAGVEVLRRPETERDPLAVFWDWGIPTADAVRQCASLRTSERPFALIASGGIQNGLDAAKSIALGADLAGAARPFLQALRRGGVKGLARMVDGWERQFRGAMFLTGSRTVTDLHQQTLMLRS
ncbi:MAG: type 2 isopentenyl-diphosphate Delta-isomerase [Bacteroidota bacterium]